MGGSPDRAASQDRAAVIDDAGVNHSYKEIKELLKELERGIHSKESMLKMVVLKCGDNAANYKKVKGFLNKGDVNGAEK